LTLHPEIVTSRKVFFGKGVTEFGKFQYLPSTDEISATETGFNDAV
jgi:hypothetical protein